VTHLGQQYSHTAQLGETTDDKLDPAAGFGYLNPRCRDTHCDARGANTGPVMPVAVLHPANTTFCDITSRTTGDALTG